jgi:hypothetical protein
MKHITLFLVFGLLYQLGFAQTWNMSDMFTSPNAEDEDHFGMIRYMDEEYLVTSAYGYDQLIGANLIENAGALYVSKKGANGKWEFTQRIVAPPGFVKANSFFGRHLTIADDYLFISDFRSGFGQVTNSGLVFLYMKGNDGLFEYQHRIESQSPHEDKYFGSSIGVSANYLFIGCYGDDFDTNGANELDQAGSVEVFKIEEDGIDYFKKITSPERSEYGHFGQEISVNSSNLAISDNIVYTKGTKLHYGKVHFYRYEAFQINRGWNYKSTIENHLADYDGFATSMAFSGNTLVISAPSANSYVFGELQTSEAGFVYVYERDYLTNTFSLEAKLEARYQNENMQFGYCIDIDGDFIVVGAFNDYTDEFGADEIPGAGATHIFSKKSGTWSFEKKIVSPERAERNRFAVSVAIHEGSIAIDDADSDVYGPEKGALVCYDYIPGTGVNELYDGDGLTVDFYPNPVSDYLILDINGLSGTAEFSLFTVLGKEVIKKTLTEDNLQLDVSQLDSGIYFVSVSTADNTFFKRVLIQ